MGICSFFRTFSHRINVGCCSVLQCIAVCCSVLQRVAVCCSILQCVAVCCSVLQCVAVCCSVLQCVVNTKRVEGGFEKEKNPLPVPQHGHLPHMSYVTHMNESCHTYV